MPWWLRPLSGLNALVINARANLARPPVKLPVPVVVVGNITVGGTGKTPVVIRIAEHLVARGRHPGIISRGHGGYAQGILLVRPDTDPAFAGDEPVLIARRTGCPVVVGRDRVAAARALLEAEKVDVIISDDGLQHARLGRDFEIVVVDAVRGLGNGALLPAGPLREPADRLQTVDLVLANGGPWRDAVPFTLRATDAVSGRTDQHRPLSGFAGMRVHAVAGIGHPQRFFDQLTASGMEVIAHAFPDHHRFRPADLAFGDNLPVFMTEKDAVKCETYADERVWVVPVVADIDPAILDRIKV